MPLTPNGKIDRKALPDPSGSAQRGEIVAPAGAAEQLVATVWEELLGLDAVGRDENFFDLGGHSLLAIKAFRELGQRSGHALALTDIFRFPTVRAFADYLDRLNTGGDTADEENAASMSRGARRRAAMSRGRGGS
jgi:hypothetical protein